MAKNQSGGLSIRAQAALYGIGKSVIATDRAAGCPADEEGGRRWRAARRRPYQRPGRSEVPESPLPNPDSADRAPELVMLPNSAEEPVPRVDGGGFKLLKAGEGEDLSPSCNGYAT
jgi:hypothetical protein